MWCCRRKKEIPRWMKIIQFVDCSNEFYVGLLWFIHIRATEATKVTHICAACTISWGLDGFPPPMSPFQKYRAGKILRGGTLSLYPLRVHRRVFFFYRLPTYTSEPLGVHAAPSRTADKKKKKANKTFSYVLSQVRLLSNGSPNEECILFTLPAWEQPWHNNE